MTDAQTTRRDPIRAAGALLWRRSPSGPEVAVIHRRRYDDWTLPKGKLEAGESWLDAAVREVREETGYDAEVLSFAGAIAYDTGRGHKVVGFWHMAASGGPRPPLDGAEVAEVVWLTPGAARERLQYPLEQILLDVLQTPEGLTR